MSSRDRIRELGMNVALLAFLAFFLTICLAAEILNAVVTAVIGPPKYKGSKS